jgi:hypothetical protein
MLASCTTPEAPVTDTSISPVGELLPKTHQREDAQSSFATSVGDSLQRSGKWAEWQRVEPRLLGFDSLEAAREGWRRRDVRCYQVVAGLAALGSRRAGNDDDAALAVVVLLQDGVKRLAMTLSDVCERDDVTTAVWEEVKRAEPHLGCQAAGYLLRRARQRLCRPAAGMISRVNTTSLEARVELAGQTDQDRDLVLAVTEAENPAGDLADLLMWAQGAAVIPSEDVDLLVELLAAEKAGLAREEAQRLVGERLGVAMRTVRRRRDRTTARLREAAPRYLAAIA